MAIDKQCDRCLIPTGIYIFYPGKSDVVVWSGLNLLKLFHEDEVKIELTSEYLKTLSEVDLLSAYGIRDIKEVSVNKKLKGAARLADYVKQIGNPYCFTSNGIKVKLCFEGEKTLTDCIKNSISVL